MMDITIKRYNGTGYDALYPVPAAHASSKVSLYDGPNLPTSGFNTNAGTLNACVVAIDTKLGNHTHSNYWDTSTLTFNLVGNTLTINY